MMIGRRTIKKTAAKMNRPALSEKTVEASASTTRSTIRPIIQEPKISVIPTPIEKMSATRMTGSAPLTAQRKNA